MEINDSLLIHDMRPYVLWRRVSTKEQGESGLGLEAQLEFARLFTKREPVKVFTDVYSGTKLMGCTGLWEAIAYCKEHGTLLVIAKTDRFRNVKEALEVLDAIGDGNLAFCDMPVFDRSFLTVMFTMWERQAIMGRINTKRALEVRKRQAAEDGGWISKTGRYRQHLGNEKGCDMTQAALASAKKRMEDAERWRQTSVAFRWVAKQLMKGVPRKKIIEEFNENMTIDPVNFSTPKGKPLTEAILSKWSQYVCKI